MNPLLNPMNKSLITLAFILATACCSVASVQAQSTLTPVQQRITDEAIVADQKAYEQLEERLHALNEGGRPVRDYHMAKAQCWLDVSLHEYTRNDRSPFPQGALTESEKLIVGMEKKVTPLPTDTPLINGAVRLRPDLWARTQALQVHAGFACAAQKAACADVELVHAGNEHNQQQWRHAKPYVQMAEDLIAQAESAASNCLPPAAVPLACPVAATPSCVVPAPTTAPAPEKLQLSAAVVFNFDRFTQPEMRPQSQASLKDLIRQTQGEKVKVQEILLTGHADRLNSTGKKDYNQELSRKRAETVRQLLVEAGLPAAIVSYEYLGDTRPVVKCDGKFKTTAELEECLLPNRRVEVQLIGVRAP